MRGIVRVQLDKTKGHGCYPPTIFLEGSKTVFCDGVPIVLEGSPIQTHCCGPACHSGVAQPTDTTFFIEGKRVMQRGDPVSCGDFAEETSTDCL